MGLVASSIRFLLREHRRSPLKRPVIVLGRQDVYATPEEIVRIFHEEGVEVHPLSAEHASAPADRQLFLMMGLDLVALDVSTYEGAELVGDLNKPIADEHRHRYGTVLDPGTLEHIFDIRRGFMNVGDLLMEGGRAIHVSPVNNWVNHGFYQFSPTVFLDYYRVNSWADVRATLFEQDIDNPNGTPWRAYEIDPDNQPALLTSNRALGIGIVATKSVDATTDRIPTQSYYERVFASTPAAPPRTSALKRLARQLPSPLKRRIKRALRRDPARAPWGLRRID